MFGLARFREGVRGCVPTGSLVGFNEFGVVRLVFLFLERTLFQGLGWG